MADQLYVSKLDRFFGLMDENHDHFLALEDFMGAADRASVAFGFGTDSPEHIGLRGYYVSLWDDIYAPMDRDADQRLTFEELLHAHEESFLDRPGGYESLRPVAQGFMTIADANHDGTVTRDEFVVCMTNAFRVPTPAAGLAFDAIDRDHNGNLTHEELHQAVEEFFCHSDPGAPGNNLFGPLT